MSIPGDWHLRSLAHYAVRFVSESASRVALASSDKKATQSAYAVCSYVRLLTALSVLPTNQLRALRLLLWAKRHHRYLPSAICRRYRVHSCRRERIENIFTYLHFMIKGNTN